MRFLDSVRGGPACRFGDAHIYYVLHTLQRNGKMGRRNLADAVGIGEGSLRTMIASLKEWDLLDVKQSGIALSDIGRRFMSDIPMDLVDVPYSDYVLGAFQSGALVRGAADKVTDGMTQRDTARIAGADGASVFVMNDGVLMMPPTWSMDAHDKDFSDDLRSKVDMNDGDVLVISGAKDMDQAAVSAIAAGLEML